MRLSTVGQITNKKIQINGVNIFYREAGDKKKPAILLLHGFPSSSVMFKNLMYTLCDDFYLVAPDYPGFGFSDFPDPKEFEYSFRNIASIIHAFTDKINLKEFVVYLHDYGCPIGLRLCIKSPFKIKGIIVQNGNAYDEGIGPEWNETKDYWENPTPEKKQKVAAFLSQEGTKFQYTGGLPEHLLEKLSPELWLLDWHFLNRPGNIEMQMTLNTDYKNNMEMYPAFQEYFRKNQPPALIIWGKYDIFFNVKEAKCYKQDLPNAKIHIVDGGHKALETNFKEVVTLVATFLAETYSSKDLDCE